MIQRQFQSFDSRVRWPDRPLRLGPELDRMTRRRQSLKEFPKAVLTPAGLTQEQAAELGHLESICPVCSQARNDKRSLPDSP